MNSVNMRPVIQHRLLFDKSQNTLPLTSPVYYAKTTQASTEIL